MSILNPGDLALIGYSSDTAGKSFAFVLLHDVDGSTTINFTDDGWLAAGGFRTGEGVVTWNAPAGGASAGTVIAFTGLTGSFNPSTSGDQIIAFQGPLSAAATPLFALDFADNNTAFAADATSSNTSAVPAGLTFGTTALAFGPDNGAYTGPTAGTAGDLLQAIDNPANWTTDDTNPVAYRTSFTVSAGSSVSIGAASVAEGDSGDQILTFTVTRGDAATAFSVDFATHDGSASAGSDYAETHGTLTFAAGGPLTQTISVAVHGDTVVEGNETLTVDLSNLQNTTGATSISSGTGTGTILNDDVQLVHTYDIQGAGHTSPLVGQHVITEGVVTAIDTTGSRGFWIQDQAGDGDDATSDAVFVFTNAVPTIHVGDLVRVDGTVNEFQGNDTNNLTITEVGSSNAQVTFESAGHTIAPTLLGDGGRHIPTEVIDNDHFGTFDPAQDGIDFYESLEGMIVTVHNVQAVDSTFLGQTFVVADNGDAATGMNDRGGITIAPGDMNPERIELFNDSGVSNIPLNAVAGDHLGDVTGVISYFGGNYELLPLSVGSTASSGAAPRDTTSLVGDATHLTVAEYNLENIDPTDPQAKFDALASDIAHNLGSPNILALEEIQDADGAGNGTDFSGAATLNKLIDAIVAAGGPHYQFVEIAPTANNQNGGEPNGNIRQAFLYDPSKVSYVAGSAHQIFDDDAANGDAYNNSRHPLVADFQFRGETVTIVGVHNFSRGGSDELFGQDQPPINAGDQRRIDQTSPIEHTVQQLEAANPQAHIIVTGDFNGFQFETAQTQLETGGILTDLTNQLDPTDRYSFIFEGNMEQIDLMYASPSLSAGSQFDIVHLNTGQDASRPTDHDPTLGRFLINTGPVANGDSASVSEDQSVTIDVLGNDTDVNTGDTKTIEQVSATALGGHVSIVNGQVVYVADADSFDLLTTGQHVTDSFSYVMHDAAGATSTATVNVTVNGVANAPTQNGGNGDSTLTGTAGDEALNGGNGADSVSGGEGADSLTGGNGNDVLDGGASIDMLSGGNGDDTLPGGAGDDFLAGGRGNDLFRFGQGFGHDVVGDFASGQDHIRFEGVGFASFSDVMAHATQSAANVIITDAAGDTVQLNNINLAGLHPADFLFA